MRAVLLFFLFVPAALFPDTAGARTTPARVLEQIGLANARWRETRPEAEGYSWDNAVYHTGNMEVFFLTGDSACYDTSLAWAENNGWTGAKSEKPEEWLYSYGETDEYVLFGDNQACFQVYADLYKISPEERKIARARGVMEYQMGTPEKDYWWWADGLYMVMPVMVKMYNLTGNALYAEKLHEYWHWADSVMYDAGEGLYYRDERYVYPEHKTSDGKKDFWARGNGWVVAALAKVLKELPAGDEHYGEYKERYLEMAASVAACQSSEGYWTRSLLDADYAPGPETSGTAFFTYALLWGVNNGLLDADVYGRIAEKAWDYLSNTALQADGSVGYVQPIGDRAVPGQVVDAGSTAGFGVGAFLLAGCEMLRYLDGTDRR